MDIIKILPFLLLYFIIIPWVFLLYLVFLYLGWAASFTNHVKKYTQLYANEFGIGAHGYILPMEITFSYNHGRIREIAEYILEEVSKEKTGKRIVLHFFSNNGLAFYKHFSELFENGSFNG